MGNTCKCNCNKKTSENPQEENAVSFHEEDNHSNDCDYNAMYNKHLINNLLLLKKQNESTDTIQTSLVEEDNIMQDYIYSFSPKSKSFKYNNNKPISGVVNSASWSSTNNTNTTNSNGNAMLFANENISFNPNSGSLNNNHLDTISELINENTVTLISKDFNVNNNNYLINQRNVNKQQQYNEIDSYNSKAYSAFKKGIHLNNEFNNNNNCNNSSNKTITHKKSYSISKEKIPISYRNANKQNI